MARQVGVECFKPLVGENLVDNIDLDQRPCECRLQNIGYTSFTSRMNGSEFRRVNIFSLLG